MIYLCCDERRRELVDASALNGIDFLEVIDHDAPTDDLRQRTLLVVCLKPVPAGFTKDHVRIDGGERISPVLVEWAFPLPALLPPAVSPVALLPAEIGFLSMLQQPDHVFVVRTNVFGDYSDYRLSLKKSSNENTPPDDFDDVLSTIDFNFKVECESPFDCRRARVCPSEEKPVPEIDYLARDYASFRRLMLDRMALLLPQWRERSPADLGIALVELLSYVGDRLSYEQDAVATEAYLGTARKRVSVRRHARLVDYSMHDGCNARAWIHLRLDAGAPAAGILLKPFDPASKVRTRFVTRCDAPIVVPPAQFADLLRDQAFEVFEPLHEIILRREHNEMFFHTWGDERCCLPRGATKATLKGHLPDLEPGSVLIFEEIRGPRTGDTADADPLRRHAVRLSRKPELAEDPLPTPQPVTNIEWSVEDALPFPFCLWEVEEPGNDAKHPVSHVLGNIVLVDHGRTIESEDLGVVPESTLFRLPQATGDPCAARERAAIPVRFRPALAEAPVTQAGTVLQVEEVAGQTRKHRVPFDPTASAAAALKWEMKSVLPAIALNDGAWRPRRDLLGSNADDLHFVVEVETDSPIKLRFGDDQHGKRPDAGTAFQATYRVGNGTSGNVGAGAVHHIVGNISNIEVVRNPLSARGGVDPESIEEVRHRAPVAFQTNERAVTEADYAEVAQRQGTLQRAAATFRWTGSWHTVFLTADRKEGRTIDLQFKDGLRDFVERYRMAGHDLEVDGPRYVPLEIEMHVCVKPDYFRSDVVAALLDVFSNRVLPDGRRGVFHADNFTFEQTVFLSPLYAAAQQVDGVASVRITKFGRLGSTDPKPLTDGKLTLGRLEIARLDHDPNFPERGVFTVKPGGGK